VGRSSGNLLFSFEDGDGSAKETTKEKAKNRNVFHLDDVGFHSDRTFYYSLLQIRLFRDKLFVFFSSNPLLFVYLRLLKCLNLTRDMLNH